MKNFYHWMKEQITLEPTRELDQRIRNMAHEHLVESHFQISNNWKLITVSISFAAVLSTLIVVSMKNQNEVITLATGGPSEMILNYNEMELMADSAILTDRDWDALGITKL
jgi:hypothetical protein